MNKAEVINVLEAEREELIKKLQSLELTIITLKQSLVITSANGWSTIESSSLNGTTLFNGKEQSRKNSKYESYYSAKSTKDKVAAILKAEGKFLHMRQIVQLAQNLEPKADREKLAKQIQLGVYALKNMENQPIVTKIINNINMNAFWGSKNWLDANGDIKPEHMFDEDQLVGSKKEAIEI